MIVLSLLSAAAGFVIRDGWPALGSTNLARLVGLVFLVIAAGAAGLGPHQFILGVAAGLGFWADRLHAEGQQARNAHDDLMLLVSGLTSFVPLAAAFFYFHQFQFMWFTLGVACLKPVIWTLAWWAWRRAGESQSTWFVPTRVAAMALGVCMGALLYLGAT